MRLLPLTVATVLAFLLHQTPHVLAQGYDNGAVGRPLQLDGGSPLGADNRGQTGARSEGTAPSAGPKGEESQTGIEKTGETMISGRSHTHVRLSSRAKHQFAFHGRGHHIFAFRLPRHHFVIHRHSRRFVAVDAHSTAS
ncbi:MAG TPA: hypothetical protein VKC66_13435 [Xanthobacteraceae bacterium]|nr:hypothetical protein [Xanthobacteraceae bacterium]